MSRKPNPRVPEGEVDSMFLDRWSPRSFLSDPVPEHLLAGLFEAARWAPSCFGEEPWLFVYASSAEERARFLPTLAEKNQAWAKNASVLIYVLAKRNFTHNGKENRHAAFDAGAAWMSLALQARRFGLYAHAMAGFSEEEAGELLRVKKEEYHIMAAIAVGRIGDPAALSEEMREMEAPNERKPLAEVAIPLSSFA